MKREPATVVLPFALKQIAGLLLIVKNVQRVADVCKFCRNLKVLPEFHIVNKFCRNLKLLPKCPFFVRSGSRRKDIKDCGGGA